MGAAELKRYGCEVEAEEDHENRRRLRALLEFHLPDVFDRFPNARP